MTKTEFIKAWAAEAHITNKLADEIYDAFYKTIVDSLKKGEKIALPGFLTFEIKNKPAREGINPKTKAKIKIAASKAPAVKLGKTFKEEF
ncbi:MAG: HU family DNA-binding protein [Firmicutes bacterium]|nr:HU family DNA-binding protein [Bacillota bacterium]